MNFYLFELNPPPFSPIFSFFKDSLVHPTKFPGASVTG